MKIMTRCVETDQPVQEVYAAIGRSFIDAYIDAARQMGQLIYLSAVEPRQQHYDLQFVLTFEPLSLTRAVNEQNQSIDYTWCNRP